MLISRQFPDSYESCAALERSGIAHFSESVRGALFFNEKGVERLVTVHWQKSLIPRVATMQWDVRSARKFVAAPKAKIAGHGISYSKL
jgi:hypothetical protein